MSEKVQLKGGDMRSEFGYTGVRRHPLNTGK